jgi:rhamnulokinase
MESSSYLAFDLGATSGRAIIGTLDNRRLKLTEAYRFSNAMHKENGRYFWNVSRLFNEITKGMAAACEASTQAPVSAIGVDTWGVDFGLFDERGALLTMPLAYRDPITDGIMDEVFGIIPRATLYEKTGVQFLQFNSLYQLFAIKKFNPDIFNKAAALLFMPDIFHYMLTGCASNEYTIASTSQLLNAARRDWDAGIIDALGFPRHLFQTIVQPSTVIGEILPALARKTGIDPHACVRATASHDTASAVAAVPALTANFAYISSGTWSLMGIETGAPIITPETLSMNFTNEGGACGTCRVLKNITGMWLLEECRRVWNMTDRGSYDELIAAAAGERPFRALIDPDDPAFAHPADMPGALCRAAALREQFPSASQGAVTRMILESLALKYRLVLDELRIISPHPIDVLHVIGGGSRNALLCQWTADACGIPVVAGPAEATAIGNILLQSIPSGCNTPLAAMRDIVVRSFPTVTFTPGDTGAWNKAYARFRNLYSH